MKGHPIRKITLPSSMPLPGNSESNYYGYPMACQPTLTSPILIARCCFGDLVGTSKTSASKLKGKCETRIYEQEPGGVISSRLVLSVQRWFLFPFPTFIHCITSVNGVGWAGICTEYCGSTVAAVGMSPPITQAEWFGPQYSYGGAS